MLEMFLLNSIIIVTYVHVVTTVKFSQSVYNVNEDSGLVQLMLVLSNPVSFGFTVEVFNTNVTAIGKDFGVLDASWSYRITLQVEI